MRPQSNKSSLTAAVLTLSEIKAAVEAFDRGETNVCDAMDTIVVEVEAYQKATKPGREAA